MTVASPVITATMMALDAVMSATATASENWTHTGGHPCTALPHSALNRVGW
jgi:hypothetical protein